MSTPSVAGRVTLFTCAALLAGCVDGLPSEPSSSAALPHPSAAGYDEVRPAEAEFARLARDVPGAGGFFFDENGTVVVYLKDRGRADAARQAVLGILARTGRPSQPGGQPAVVALAGRFDFFELNRARNRITDPVLDIDGVVSVDLDEGRNRVTVGVSEPSARARVEARLAELGVGRDIVNIESADEIIAPIDDEASPGNLYSPTVAGFTRPLVGGTQIGRRRSDPEKFSKCTMSFTGRLNDGTRVFITNSHCSSASWDTDGSIFHQPFPSRYDETQRVGYEYRDRRGESCGFLSPNVCRYADATAVRIDDAVEAETGYIVRTRFYSDLYSIPGSLEIDPANPRFRIVAKGGFPFSGQYSNKIGATTGWTRGFVEATCSDVSQPRRDWSKLRCQYSTYAGSAKGDSGSPVFYDRGDGTVTIEGIMWGTGGGQFWWSPIHGVERDLGGINLFAPSSPGGGSGNELPPPHDCTVDPSLPC